MYIRPTLLLFVIVIFVFAPSIQEWITQGGSSWYRPYQVWLATVVFVWWSIHRVEKRETNSSDKDKSSDEL